MKAFFKKVSAVLRVVFGYGVFACLFVGGLTFFGYLAALIIGGETATLICDFLFNKVLTYCIYCSTIMVLLGLVVMYLNGEVALTMSKKKETAKHEGEL